MYERFFGKLFDKVEENGGVQIIRSSFVLMIPVLLLGSFSLVLRSLPVEPYQDFIQALCSGTFYLILELIYNGTFGMLSIYMVITMSFSCTQYYDSVREESNYGAVITSLGCFTISSGFLSDAFDSSVFGVKGMFLAIFCALGASWIYRRLSEMLWMRQKKRLLSDGADADFNGAVGTVLPAALVMLIFAAVNLFIYHTWGISGLQEVFVRAAEYVFHGMGRTLGSGLVFVLFSSILWFVGIHGSDVLDNVSQSLFAEGIHVNAALAAAGQEPTEIVTKTFFDVFVLMGGCGSTLCLLLALGLFSRRRSNNGLAGMAALPMLFNINELMVFGLPVVFNPVLLIPFLLTPVVCTLTAYGAFAWGLVPIPIVTVEWTTPVLWGGYAATGSFAGTFLQLFNLVVGTLIYRPFVREYDREKIRSARRRVKELQEILMEGEKNNNPVELLRISGPSGRIARALSAELQAAIEEERLYLRYQPQFDQHKNCIGAEALLRWDEPLTGSVYPPLIIALAGETGQLITLEEYVLNKALDDLPALRKAMRTDFRLCINVTAKSIFKDEFLDFLGKAAQRVGLAELEAQGVEVSLEITEQTALMSDHLGEHLQRIREMGFSLSIDDFSMGFTSLKYLQQSQFSLVKLDGSLVQDLMNNKRNQDIISSIVQLSHSLSFCVLAEYVETEEQRKTLEQVGCLQYQGYLYSAPIPLEAIAQLNQRLN